MDLTKDLTDLFSNTASNPVASKFTDLGSVLSALFQIIFYLAIFLAFAWLAWGAFQYLFAGGKKEELAKARTRITWAIIGLIIILLAFTLTQFGAEILQYRGGLPF